jgi:hypothetical protein
MGLILDLIVIPTRTGEDLNSKDGTKDLHIRLEGDSSNQDVIVIDVFDGRIRSSIESHLFSEHFPNTERGAHDASILLQALGFREIIMVR